MAAMKPRTGDGPLEVTKEGRGVIMRVPLEGGGRLVVEMTPEEAETLSKELENLAKLPHVAAPSHLLSLTSDLVSAFELAPTARSRAIGRIASSCAVASSPFASWRGSIGMLL
ncbi:DUF3117 domain-containing protein [Natronoglycomyces albus]|uniref:DUF3117 domain-containing protein n=1 Tax=Natronoglycomyces albus TaxID=2811108 RepID=A0A895XSI8_9ACTN|nr:DUF3117 domain-containing protein [Natronoglycomyces albus]